MVRPWKLPSVAARRRSSVSRVSLRAASLASAPELVKKTLPGPPSSWSFFGEPIWGWLAKKLEM